MSPYDPSEPGATLNTRAASTLARAAVESSRLGTYALFGSVVAAIPLPWVPGTMTERLRGALVHDVAGRYDVALTPEARRVLADPRGGKRPRIFVGLAQFAAGRALARLGPLAVLPTARAAVEVFVLGRLFERYLAARRERNVRLDLLEARHVRALIDEALLHAFASDAPATAPRTTAAPEELRDETTRFVDDVLIAAAGVPGFLVRKVEAAFDELLLLRPTW